MENPRVKIEKINKSIRNLFRLKIEQNDTATEDIRNIFRIKKYIKGIEAIVLRSIKKLFEYEKEEENYYKPVRVNNFWNNNYIKYESNGDKNNNLSLDEYLNKIKSYLKDIIIDLQSFDTWKIQVTIEIDFISSKDNEEKCEMYSDSNNIKFTS